MTVQPETGGFALTRPIGTEHWQVNSESDRVVAARRGGLTELRYEFLNVDGAWECVAAEVRQFGRKAPCVRMHLSPALPDLRRPFVGERQSRFAIDVNGQPAHARGRILARSTEAGAEVDVCGEAPAWVASRPMRTTVQFGAGGAEIRCERVAAVR